MIKLLIENIQKQILSMETNKANCDRKNKMAIQTRDENAVRVEEATTQALQLAADLEGFKAAYDAAVAAEVRDMGDLQNRTALRNEENKANNKAIGEAHVGLKGIKK